VVRSKLAAKCLRPIALTFSATALSACAQVTAVQLQPGTLTARPGAPSGFVYYMPRPYLLVTALPTGGSAASQPTGTFPGTRGSQGGQSSSPQPQDFQAPAPGADEGGGGDAAKTPPPSTNTSFQASNDRYMLKLIYLPDLSRPMAVRVSSGLFGSASAQLSLQDGWMLTSASGESDSKASETLTALAALITATARPAAGGGAPGGAPGAGPDRSPAPMRVLAPGLYAFDYEAETGRLRGLCRLTDFGPAGAMAASIPSCSARLASATAASVGMLGTQPAPAGSAGVLAPR
jgi:hypothetical protein